MKQLNILSSTYLGSVQWFARLIEGAVIDLGEHYVKQTYRNRCRILGAGGVLDLTVNVSAKNHTPMRDVRIDYSKRWEHVHLEALRSAYGRAPFFEHYWPELEPVLRRRHRFLVELNGELLAVLSRLLKIEVSPLYSESYVESGGRDFRGVISPKRAGSGYFVAVPYWQLWGGFEPDLSVVDLLFCEGPVALEIIKKSNEMSARDL